MKVNVNGKDIKNYTITRDGCIIISKESYETTDPINGIIKNAYYCKYKDSYAWKIELKKNIAKGLGLKIHVAWVKTRDEALNEILQSNKLISSL